MDQANNFVYSKIRKPISDRLFLEPDDVGIVESLSNGDRAAIFFVRIWSKLCLENGHYERFTVRNTGDAFPKKICNICHKLLDTTLFARNQNGVNNRPVRRPSCTPCRKILEGIHIKPVIRNEWLKIKPHNVPFECPICGKRTIAGVTCKVVLDHNHVTGEARAWICDSCNTGIGRFKDDVAILQRAIAFLA